MKTPKELEAHIKKELALKTDIEGLIERLEKSDYRTKTEKKFLNDTLAAKRQELIEHRKNPPQA